MTQTVHKASKTGKSLSKRLAIVARMRDRQAALSSVPFTPGVVARLATTGTSFRVYSGLSLLKVPWGPRHGDMLGSGHWPITASLADGGRPEFDSCFRRGSFSRSSHTSDLKIGPPVATLPGAWHYSVSAETCWPGVSIL